MTPLHSLKLVAVPAQSAAENARKEAMARHPGAIEFLLEDKGSGGPLDYQFTIENQDDLAENPAQAYWLQDDTFDIYRTSKGVSVFSHPADHTWLTLRCTEQQAAGIVELRKASHKGATFLFFFSLANASPLHVELKAESTPGVQEDESPLANVVADDVSGDEFKGKLIEAVLLDGD